ncbi:hypothetical protein RFI_36674, partial [Reticulomyxa filosa]
MIGKKVIFSDETRINLRGSDGIKYVWKKPNQDLGDMGIIKRSRFGGGSIMIWACFGAKSIGNTSMTEGGMNSEIYTEILEDDMLKSVNYCVNDENDWSSSNVKFDLLTNLSSTLQKILMEYYSQNLFMSFHVAKTVTI